MDKETLVKILKNKNNRLICIIFIIGVVMMVTASADKKNDNPTREIYVNTASEDEKRLEEILSKIDGVGDVSVMITYYSSSEKSIAYETKTSSREREESEDKRAVMTDGTPMVLKEIYPEVKGVVIAADGGGNKIIKAEILRAVSASLDVPIHRISIFKKED